MEIPQGLWAVASDLQNVAAAQQWCRSATPAAAFTMRRSQGHDVEVLAVMRSLLGEKAWLASHGRADLVQLAGASAVIAGVRSLSVATYRRSFPQLIVGASSHSLQEAQAACDAGAHFLFFGPVWDTPEKSGILAPRGLEQLTQIVHLGVPVVAIGGIVSVQQVQQVQDCGAHGVAVLRSAQRARLMADLSQAWK